MGRLGWLVGMNSSATSGGVAAPFGWGPWCPGFPSSPRHAGTFASLLSPGDLILSRLLHGGPGLPRRARPCDTAARDAAGCLVVFSGFD